MTKEQLKEFVETGLIGLPIQNSTLITITNSGKRYEGEGQYGPWSLQSVGTEEGIDVLFSKCRDISDLEGKTIMLEPYQGKKGVIAPTVNLNKKNDTRNLKITAGCRITDVDGNKINLYENGKTIAASIGIDENRVREIVQEMLDKYNSGNVPF